MLTFDTTAIRANSVAFGNQSGPEVVALEGGGFVVAWTDQQLSTTNSRNVLFQRYDANGVALGGNTMVAATNGSSEVLTDLVALPGGGFAVAWLSSGATNMQGYSVSSLQQLPVVRAFSAAGTAVSGDVVLHIGTATNNIVNGLELVATAGGFRAIFANADPSNWTLRAADLSAAGAILGSINLGSVAAGTVVEAIAAPGFNGQLVLLSPSSINRQATLLTTTAAPGSPIGVPNAFDVIDLGTGLVTTVGTLPSPLLSGDTSVASEMYQYPALVAGLPANDVALLNIGDNVFLQAIAGNGVLSLRAVDAVTGAITDTATIETGPSAQDVELTRLVDGRIVVTWWRSDVFGAETFFRILATDGIPTFTGTGLGDSLTGSGAADVIAGLDGNDTITATAGADTIDGGAGIDTLLYTSAAGPVLVDLTTPANNGDAALGQVLTGIEVVLGTALNDRITGSAGADTLNGGAGNDQLNGGDGDDVLVLSAGADTMNGGAGNDTARLTGATSALVIDLPKSSNNAGAALGLVLTSMETIEGGAFNDFIIGRSVAELFLGNGGNDTIAPGGGGDTVDGGSGTDRLSYAAATAGIVLDRLRPANGSGAAAGIVILNVEEVEGTAFADRILGSNAADLLLGGAGDDVLRGRSGADTLDGGAGNDSLDAGASGFPGAWLFGGSGDDRMIGGIGADVLMGGIGQDDAFGAIGADTIEGGAGDDVLDGGADGDMLEGGDGNDRLHGRDGSDSLFGGLGADMLTGYDGADFADGEEGNDTAYGGEGADTLFGGEGNDILAGGLGDDILHTGDGVAEIATGGAGNDDIVAGGGRDALYGDDGDDEIDAGAGDDLISGGLGADLLLGGLGNDTIKGEGGADTIDGGGGDDLITDTEGGADIYGGEGFDTVSFATRGSSQGAVLYLDNDLSPTGAAALHRFHSIESVVGTTLNDSVFGAAAGDYLIGWLGNDELGGRAGDDSLDGGGGDDLLDGGPGNDLLIGGLGNDVLFGGAGNDVFRFDRRVEAGDVIEDFETGDRIQILRAGFSNVSSVIFTAEALTATSSGFPRLFFDTAGPNAGFLFYDANAADLADRILLASIRTFLPNGESAAYTALTAGDFLFA